MRDSIVAGVLFSLGIHVVGIATAAISIEKVTVNEHESALLNVSLRNINVQSQKIKKKGLARRQIQKIATGGRLAKHEAKANDVLQHEHDLSPKIAARETGEFVEAHCLYQPSPIYPQVSRENEEEGVVTVRLMVNKDGSVDEVSILQSSGIYALDQSAKRALEQWQFKPAMKDGLAVVSSVDIPVRFELN